MDFFEAVKERRSVRKFRQAPVERDLLVKLVDSARLAPTARNEQPWEFVIITDTNRIKQLADIVKPNGAFLASAPAAIVVLSKDTKYYLEDGSAATAHILLAASALQLGACWIAGDKKDYCDDVLGFVNSRGLRLISVIAVGYPEGEPVSKEKRPLSEVLHWDFLST